MINLKFKEIADITLVRFYEIARWRTSNGFIHTSEVNEINPLGLSQVYISEIFTFLDNEQFIKGEQGSRARITKLGIEHIEQEHDDPNSIIYKFMTGGDAWLENYSESKVPIERKLISQADSADWEPLPIDRQSKEFSTAIAATEKAIEVLEADNGFAASEPEKRSGLLATLKQGVEALRGGVVSRRAVDVLLIKPFAYVMKRFADGLVAEAAKYAFQKLLALIGNFPHA